MMSYGLEGAYVIMDETITMTCSSVFSSEEQVFEYEIDRNKLILELDNGNEAVFIKEYQPKMEGKMGIASLVLGIISIIIGLFSGGGLGWLGAILGIIGIIMGSQGKKRQEEKGIASAGFICSIIGTILCLLMYAACVACVGGMALLS